MINRAAVVVKFKAPFIKWINEANPFDKRPAITLAEANEDRTIYLIDEDEADHVEDWIALNYGQLFESELEDWEEDSALWPQNRTKELFAAWIEVQCHTVIVDTVGSDIVEDGL